MALSAGGSETVLPKLPMNDGGRMHRGASVQAGRKSKVLQHRPYNLYDEVLNQHEENI